MRWVLTVCAAIGLTTRLAFAAPVAGRVINGDPATEGEWPFVVALVFAGEDETVDLINCAGTLIHPKFVLTAAHCVVDFGDGAPIPPEFLEIVAGKTRLTSSSGVRVAVDKVIVNPGYEPFGFRSILNDLAILRLAEPLPLAVVGLPDGDDAALAAAGSPATILGWGATDPDHPVLPDVLQEAVVPIVANEECAETHGLLFKGEAMICAGVRASGPDAGDGVDVCSGDSGGPLLVRDGDVWTQLGITSWGFECGSHEFVGVYTRVANYASWVGATLDVVAQAQTALDRLVPILESLKRRRSRTLRQLAKGTVLELQDLAAAFGGEIVAALPNFTPENVKRLARAVRQGRVRKANRVARALRSET